MTLKAGSTSTGLKDPPIGPILIVGLGPVGAAFAGWFRARGLDVRGWDLRPSTRTDAVAAGGTPVTISAQAPPLGDLRSILLAVTDHALPELGLSLGASLGELQASQTLPAGLVVLHTSGAQPSSVLRAALPVQVGLGGAHPVFPFSGSALPDPGGMALAVEGDVPGVERAEALARLLGMRAFRLDVAGKTLYHAGLALLSNGAVGLFASSERLLAAAGVEALEARALLLDLLAATGRNLAAQPAREALTGPIKRGDEALAEAHLAAVAAGLPEESSFVAAVQERQRLLCRPLCSASVPPSVLPPKESGE